MLPSTQNPPEEGGQITNLTNTTQLNVTTNNTQSHKQSTVIVNNQPTLMSYAGATATEIRPKKEQAIIIDSILNCTNDDYIDGLENIIDTVHIRHISKISGKRVCVFFDSEENANKVTNKVIQVKQYALKIRPLMEKNKRVVISNVSPVITNSSILQALKEKGIKPVSSITEIRASLSKPNRAHILSFGRQVYIKEDDVIPDSLTIQTDNTQYRIYLTTDLTICYICKQSGHRAVNCLNANVDAVQIFHHGNQSMNQCR